MSLDRPIFIVGVGRSGSTVFHHILSRHPRVSWLSQLCNAFPKRPELNRWLMHAIDIPGIRAPLQYYFEPDESYQWWDKYARGFSAPFRDLVAADVTNATRRSVDKVFSKLITSRRPRMLVKVTGWPRMGYLQELYPDALFIHVLRDGRAVVNSMLQVEWWWGWRGYRNWRWGDLTPLQQEEMERHGNSFIALAALQWKILMDAMETAKQTIDPARYMEVKYEDVVAAPMVELRRAVEFSQLDWHPTFVRAAERWELRDENTKWRQDLTPAQQAILEDALASHLPKYGYGEAPVARNAPASGVRR